MLMINKCVDNDYKLANNRMSCFRLNEKTENYQVTDITFRHFQKCQFGIDHFDVFIVIMILRTANTFIS